MKKIIILLLMTLLLTGCTAVRIDTSSIDNILLVLLEKNNTLYNQVGKGYKYYIPRGVTYIDTKEFNDKLYSNGNFLYLYIDAIGYYYKKEEQHTLNEDLYYSKKLDINGKVGYIEIEQQDNKYLITIYYNYTLFKALVPYKDINVTVLDATYMLSTMKFNDNIIKLALDTDYNNLEEEYNKFKSEKETNNFLEMAEEKLEIEE
ncbi:MAG: lipoprotein [Bacilli bacterium]|nr:lipoprotein [Bacilli bacterium]